jgi:hypothetical protein
MHSNPLQTANVSLWNEARAWSERNGVGVVRRLLAARQTEGVEVAVVRSHVDYAVRHHWRRFDEAAGSRLPDLSVGGFECVKIVVTGPHVNHPVS